MNFYSALFNEIESTCFTETPYGTSVSSAWEGAYREVQYFCINPLLPGSTRKDDNVEVYRNILVEFDQGTRAEQWELLSTVGGVPYTTLVWSGGKSHHLIISLVQPCETRAEYDALVRRIYAKLPTCDKSTKNPSRLSRTPNGRHKSGGKAELLAVAPRVQRDRLEEWLGPAPASQEMLPRTNFDGRRILFGSTQVFLSIGAEDGEWNTKLFAAALDMVRGGYSVDEIFDLVHNIHGQLDNSDRSTIKSAAKIVQREG